MPYIFADDTSILLTSLNNTQMQSDFNIIFEQLFKWFKPNLLFFLTLTKPILFNLLIKVLAPQTYKLHTKINK